MRPGLPRQRPHAVVLLPSNSADSYANADARVPAWHHMHWRDGVQIGRRALRRELSIRLLLRLLATNAYAYAHSDTHTHPHSYANTHTYTDARVSQRHDMHWRDGVHLWRRALYCVLSIRLLLSVPVSAV